MQSSLLILNLPPLTTIQKSSPQQASIMSRCLTPYHNELRISLWFDSKANHCKKMLVIVFFIVVLAWPVKVAWVVMAIQSLGKMFFSLRHILYIKRFQSSVRVSGQMFKPSPVKMTVPVDCEMHSVTLRTRVSIYLALINLLRILLRLIKFR